ncbi:hypothetical protein CACET_c09170 [Clostridium aceticum]|uniref:Uncharacterized protein n=1 Tax=Clostridium aceticum TaxID=84022 RepID=A0A0G3WAF7_9CLOT|nr:hypothetical protein CACET_c09170 [Clostridium aceticum]
MLKIYLLFSAYLDMYIQVFARDVGGCCCEKSLTNMLFSTIFTEFRLTIKLENVYNLVVKKIIKFCFY